MWQEVCDETDTKGSCDFRVFFIPSSTVDIQLYWTTERRETFRQCDEQPLWHTCTLHNDVLCHRKFDKRPPYVGGRDDKRHCNVSLNGLQPSNNRDKQPRERQNTTQTNASSLILLSKMYTKIVPNYYIHFMYRQLTSSRYRLDWKQKHGIWFFGMEIDMETSLYNILSNFIGNYMYNLITANQ